MPVSATVLNYPDSVEVLGTSTGTDATTLFSASVSGGNVNLVINGALDRETTAQYVLILRYVRFCVYSGTSVARTPLGP